MGQLSEIWEFCTMIPDINKVCWNWGNFLTFSHQGAITPCFHSEAWFWNLALNEWQLAGLVSTAVKSVETSKTKITFSGWKIFFIVRNETTWVTVKCSLTFLSTLWSKLRVILSYMVVDLILKWLNVGLHCNCKTVHTGLCNVGPAKYSIVTNVLLVHLPVL